MARGLLGIGGIILLIDLLCWSGVFHIYFGMTVILLLVALVTLIVPAVMILKFHCYNNGMKYLIVTATAVMKIPPFLPAVSVRRWECDAMLYC